MDLERLVVVVDLQAGGLRALELGEAWGERSASAPATATKTGARSGSPERSSCTARVGAPRAMTMPA